MLEKKIIKKGVLYKNAFEEKPSEAKSDTKTKKRFEIQEQVFDDKDSIADNAKMISLLASIISRLWETTPQSQKDDMNSTDVAMVDYFVQEFKQTETNADNKFAIEGTTLIDKLLERQQKIGDILK